MDYCDYAGFGIGTRGKQVRPSDQFEQNHLQPAICVSAKCFGEQKSAKCFGEQKSAKYFGEQKSAKCFGEQKSAKYFGQQKSAKCFGQ